MAVKTDTKTAEPVKEAAAESPKKEEAAKKNETADQGRSDQGPNPTIQPGIIWWKLLKSYEIINYRTT